MQDLKQSRRVLVTGGASGIGLAVVRAFVGAGDEVVSLDLTESEWATVSVIGDVRDPAAHKRAVDAARGSCGLDILVSNAGIHDGGLSLDADITDLARVVSYIGLWSRIADIIGCILSRGPDRCWSRVHRSEACAGRNPRMGSSCSGT